MRCCSDSSRVRGATWRRPRDVARADSNNENLHELRKELKRLECACEVLGLVVGKAAVELAQSANAAQQQLGVVHDEAVARAWLKSLSLVEPELKEPLREIRAFHKEARRDAKRGWKDSIDDGRGQLGRAYGASLGRSAASRCAVVSSEGGCHGPPLARALRERGARRTGAPPVAPERRRTSRGLSRPGPRQSRRTRSGGIGARRRARTRRAHACALGCTYRSTTRARPWWSTSTAAGSSWGTSTRTTRSVGGSRRTRGCDFSPSTTDWRPEHPFPAGINDAVDTIRYVLANLGEFDDAERRADRDGRLGRRDVADRGVRTHEARATWASPPRW